MWECLQIEQSKNKLGKINLELSGAQIIHTPEIHSLINTTI